MGNNDNSNSEETKLTATSKGHSSLVEAMRILVPAVSAVVVAYFGYLQMTQPKMLEIAATQTALAISVAAASTSQAGPPQATETEMPATAATDSAAAIALPATPISTPLSTPAANATSIATTAAESAPTPTLPSATATPAPETPSPTATTATAASATTVPAAASAEASPAGDMVLITTREGGDPVAVLPETLRFQGNPGIDLLSGEWIPFTNIMAIVAGQTRAGIVPLELTFTDGATQSAGVDKDASLIQAETAHGSIQMHMDQVTRIEFPNPAQTPAQPQPSQQEMVALVGQDGEIAHVIANSLRFQGKATLNLRSGEYIPLANIVTINVRQVRVDNAPLELTFTDGATQSATVDKDRDLFEGETLHGYYQRATHTLQQIQFPNEPQSAQPAANADALVILTTPEGDIAQVIAGTLRFQDGESLGLTSGEYIPFGDIRTLVVGTTSGSSVPIELTFTDGSIQSAFVLKDSDVFQGETLHGGYLRNVQSLKQVDFPNGE